MSRAKSVHRPEDDTLTADGREAYNLRELVTNIPNAHATVEEEGLNKPRKS